MTDLLAYVSCADEPAIVTFVVDRASGALTRRGATPVPGATGPGMSMPLALAPDRRTLHAATRQPPFRCSSFAIDPATGALSLIGGTDLPESMAYIVVEPSGWNLLGASYPGALVSSTAIGPNGAASGPPRQVIDTPLRAHAIITDFAGRFAYVPCLGGDVVLQLEIDPASGRLTQAGRLQTPAGAGPRHIRIAPSGRHAYVVGELDAKVIACTVDAHGGLAAFQTEAMLAEGTPGRIAAADLQVTPDGRFLYATERLTNIIAAWRLDTATGAMNPIGQVAAESGPRAIAIDPAGRFLLCAGQQSGAVATYAIDQATGALTRNSATHAGANANWIEFLETT